MQALAGDLAVLGFAEVLRFLAATEKTGCLRMDGPGGQGSVWVREGAVVTAVADGVPRAPLDEVISVLMRHESGPFSFDPEGPPAPSGASGAGDQPVEALLSRAWTLSDERSALHEVVPSLDLRIRLIQSIPANERRTVTAGQWRAVVALGRERSVGTLADVLGLSELGVLRVVHDLVTSGLVSLAPLPSKARSGRPAPSRDHRRRPDGPGTGAPLT